MHDKGKKLKFETRYQGLTISLLLAFQALLLDNARKKRLNTLNRAVSNSKTLVKVSINTLCRLGVSQ